jgi:hypothetical protein
MRDYAKASPQFWIGNTGKKLRGDPEAQVLAFYLISSPHANMLGLYYLPMAYLCHETGLTQEGACKALLRVRELGFCEYDEENEMIWVIEAARFQIADRLSPNDKQAIGVANELGKLPRTKLAARFAEKYRDAFHLSDEVIESISRKVLASPIEAPCKPLRSQEQEQEQVQVQEKVDATAAVDAGASNVEGESAKQNRSDACPHQLIVDTYHSHFPSGPRVTVLNDKRRKAIASRWREVRRGEYRTAGEPAKPRDQEKALRFFERYFGYCETVDWCTGRKPMDGRHWRATIDNLMGADFMAKRSDEAHDAREAA